MVWMILVLVVCMNIELLELLPSDCYNTFSVVQVLSANMPCSAIPTEGRQNGLQSCLLAGLLIQTKISSIRVSNLKIK